MKEFFEVDNEDPIEMQEAAAFFSKMDWEGGIDGLWGYGGADGFPSEVRDKAQVYGDALDALSTALDEWAADRGVRY